MLLDLLRRQAAKCPEDEFLVHAARVIPVHYRPFNVSVIRVSGRLVDGPCPVRLLFGAS